MNTPTGDTPTFPRAYRVQWQTLRMWADHYRTLEGEARLNQDYSAARKYRELAEAQERDLEELEAKANA